MATRRKRRPTHPGELLRKEVLPAAGLTQTQLAQHMGVSRRTVAALLHEKRGVTPDLAHRLARVFHTTPDVWLTMQQAVDMWDTFVTHKAEYERIAPLKVA
jgi:addiction module HigA family antidote